MKVGAVEGSKRTLARGLNVGIRRDRIVIEAAHKGRLRVADDLDRLDGTEKGKSHSEEKGEHEGS